VRLPSPMPIAYSRNVFPTVRLPAWRQSHAAEACVQVVVVVVSLSYPLTPRMLHDPTPSHRLAIAWTCTVHTCARAATTFSVSGMPPSRRTSLHSHLTMAHRKSTFPVQYEWRALGVGLDHGLGPCILDTGTTVLCTLVNQDSCPTAGL